MSDRYDEWAATLTDAEVAERARTELRRLCTGGRWQMTIPVDLDRDSDIILGEAIRRLRRAAGERP